MRLNDVSLSNVDASEIDSFRLHNSRPRSSTIRRSDSDRGAEVERRADQLCKEQVGSMARRDGHRLLETHPGVQHDEPMRRRIMDTSKRLTGVR